MKKTSACMTGWISSNVGQFLAQFEGAPPESMHWALLTCLDSNTNPAALAQSDHPIGAVLGQGQQLGKGLVFTTKKLLRLEQETPLFFGFDEIWFFHHPPIEPKPDTWWIVGPQAIDAARVAEVEDWMTSTSCSLGLGDGTGLNFCARIRGLPRYLLALTGDSQGTP